MTTSTYAHLFGIIDGGSVPREMGGQASVCHAWFNSVLSGLIVFIVAFSFLTVSFPLLGEIQVLIGLTC